jgi:hypothetical protein
MSLFANSESLTSHKSSSISTNIKSNQVESDKIINNNFNPVQFQTDPTLNRNIKFEANEETSEGSSNKVNFKFLRAKKYVDKNQKEKIDVIITKDVDRTFQSLEFFKKDKTKKFLFKILLNFCSQAEFNYIQGMNYIVASIMHHSENFRLVFIVFLFIQSNNLTTSL